MLKRSQEVVQELGIKELQPDQQSRKYIQIKLLKSIRSVVKLQCTPLSITIASQEGVPVENFQRYV